MQIEPFEMERMQSTWENQVAINLSESGVHPMRLAELLDDPGERAGLFAQLLCYTQTNGTPRLRDEIAALYPGASRDHVQVTNGGAEANFVATWRLVEPGDEVVVMVPNYMQTWGLARAFAGRASVREWPLVERRGLRWAPDIDALARLVTPKTRLVLICNPNNPTGARLTSAELDQIASIAGRHGSWLLSDEIYRGAELDGVETPSVWGRYERAIVTAGLSKAYGLPGLRIGWIVAPPAMIEEFWGYHDYTSIAPGALNDRLAAWALLPATRARILARTRQILTGNYPFIRDWLGGRSALFSYVPPEAGAIVYVRYHRAVNSTRLTTELRERHGTLIVPGDHFGMDGYLRVGYGAEEPVLREGLDRLGRLLESYQG